MSATKPPRLALTPTEAAEALGVSYDFFTENIAPDLKWSRPSGRKRLVAVRELERYLERTSARA